MLQPPSKNKHHFNAVDDIEKQTSSEHPEPVAPMNRVCLKQDPDKEMLSGAQVSFQLSRKNSSIHVLILLIRSFNIQTYL